MSPWGSQSASLTATGRRGSGRGGLQDGGVQSKALVMLSPRRGLRLCKDETSYLTLVPSDSPQCPLSLAGEETHVPRGGADGVKDKVTV